MDGQQQVIQIEDTIGMLQKTFECPICLELMRNALSTKCDHKFCRLCIYQAIGHRASISCPVCKEPVTKRSLQNLDQWNKIMDKVRDLPDAFQKDTGLQFSPPFSCRIPLEIASPPSSQSSHLESLRGKKRKSEEVNAEAVISAQVYVDEGVVEPKSSSNKSNINCVSPFGNKRSRKKRQKKDTEAEGPAGVEHGRSYQRSRHDASSEKFQDGADEEKEGVMLFVDPVAEACKKPGKRNTRRSKRKRKEEQTQESRETSKEANLLNDRVRMVEETPRTRVRSWLKGVPDSMSPLEVTQVKASEDAEVKLLSAIQLDEEEEEMPIAGGDCDENKVNEMEEIDQGQDDLDLDKVNGKDGGHDDGLNDDDKENVGGKTCENVLEKRIFKSRADSEKESDESESPRDDPYAFKVSQNSPKVTGKRKSLPIKVFESPKAPKVPKEDDQFSVYSGSNLSTAGRKGKKRKAKKTEEIQDDMNSTQMNALIDKISDAETFDLMMSQQFRDMESEEKRKQGQDVTSQEDVVNEVFGKTFAKPKRRSNAKQVELNATRSDPERKDCSKEWRAAKEMKKDLMPKGKKLKMVTVMHDAHCVAESEAKHGTGEDAQISNEDPSEVVEEACSELRAAVDEEAGSSAISPAPTLIPESVLSDHTPFVPSQACRPQRKTFTLNSKSMDTPIEPSQSLDLDNLIAETTELAKVAKSELSEEAGDGDAKTPINSPKKLTQSHREAPKDSEEPTEFTVQEVAKIVSDGGSITPVRNSGSKGSASSEAVIQVLPLDKDAKGQVEESEGEDEAEGGIGTCAEEVHGDVGVQLLEGDSRDGILDDTDDCKMEKALVKDSLNSQSTIDVIILNSEPPEIVSHASYETDSEDELPDLSIPPEIKALSCHRNTPSLPGNHTEVCGAFEAVQAGNRELNTQRIDSTEKTADSTQESESLLARKGKTSPEPKAEKSCIMEENANAVPLSSDSETDEELMKVTSKARRKRVSRPVISDSDEEEVETADKVLNTDSEASVLNLTPSSGAFSNFSEVPDTEQQEMLEEDITRIRAEIARLESLRDKVNEDEMEIICSRIEQLNETMGRNSTQGKPSGAEGESSQDGCPSSEEYLSDNDLFEDTDPAEVKAECGETPRSLEGQESSCKADALVIKEECVEASKLSEDLGKSLEGTRPFTPQPSDSPSLLHHSKNKNVSEVLVQSKAKDQGKVTGKALMERPSSPCFASPLKDLSSSSEESQSELKVSNGFPCKPSWSFVVSGINKTLHKPLVEEMVRKLNCRFTNKFTEKTTHVIVQPSGSSSNLRCQRTLKYFQGIAAHAWVVSIQWVLDSLQQDRLLPEDSYEIRGDTVEEMDHYGPQNSRLSVAPLLGQYQICCLGSYQDISRDELRAMVEWCGGEVIINPKTLMGPSDLHRAILIEGSHQSNEKTLKALKAIKVPVVIKEWLLDSIGTFDLKPLDRYLLS